MYLVKDPTTNKVYLTNAEMVSMYAFNGTPIAKSADVADWRRVNYVPVPCLFDWQAEPGRYGPHTVVAHITCPNGVNFTAGGSITYIDAWCSDNGATRSKIAIAVYADRNSARANAQVQW